MHKITKERLALVLLVAMLLTNPLTGQYVLQGLDWAFQQMFLYGAWVTLVATIYLIGLMAYYYRRSQKINIPAKGKKKSQAYITT